MKTVKLIISGLLLSASKLNLSLLNCVTMFALLALTVVTPGTVHASGGAVDTMSLTDEPGNWFKSELTGTPFTVIKAGERVDFKINNCCTSTKHTMIAELRAEIATLSTTVKEQSAQIQKVSA